MKILVTGVNGQLGHDVLNELAPRGHIGIGSGSAAVYRGIQDGTVACTAEYVRMDITDAKKAHETICSIRPDAVIHCAAWTNVDGAEDEENIPKVFAINEGGTRNIASACKEIDAKMMYISTDYVFNGQGTKPWQPDYKDFAPLNIYGKSKLAGELTVSSLLDKFFIIRISWVFGLNGKNFVNTMLNIGKTQDIVRVVNDQIGTPTYTYDLARLLIDMIETEQYGYYHATNEGGYISWYDFACEIYRLAGMKTEVIPVTTAEYGISKAARPFNSRLDKEKLYTKGFEKLPVWQDSIFRHLMIVSRFNRCYPL